MPFHNILANALEDSPIEFFTSGVLKRALSKRKTITVDGLLNIVKRNGKQYSRKCCGKQLEHVKQYADL